MSELSALAGSEGYEACDDATARAEKLEKVAKPLFRYEVIRREWLLK